MGKYQFISTETLSSIVGNTEIDEDILNKAYDKAKKEDINLVKRKLNINPENFFVDEAAMKAFKDQIKSRTDRKYELFMRRYNDFKENGYEVLGATLEMFEKYKELCQSKMIGIGKLWLYKSEDTPQWVLNFPTKFHWKYPSKMEYLEAGLQKFVDSYEEKGITSIAFPLLGTHNGGLDKIEVIGNIHDNPELLKGE